MQKMTFVGTDVSLEISLLEYGLLLSTEPHEDGSGTHFAIYSIGNDMFDCGHIPEKDVDNLIKGEGWANEKDVEAFLSFIGQGKEEWLQFRFINKLADVMSYWGYENIFGTSYGSSMCLDEVKDRYLYNQ